MNDDKSTYTTHGVLAAAYPGGTIQRFLTHASIDDGDHAVCARVKPGHLADDLGTPVNCPHCLRIIEKLGLTLQLG